MGDAKFSVESREATGKGVARKLRQRGLAPGVVYGGGREATAIAFNVANFERLLEKSHGGINTLIDLKVAGGGDFDGRQVLVKELQRDPISGAYLHADLYAVDLAQTIHVSVPIHLTGTAIGVSLGGGILDFATRELDVECLPNAIPEEFTLDVSALEIGDSLHVRDIAIAEGVEILNDPDVTVLSVVAPVAIEEEAPAEEAGEEGEAVDAEATAEGAAPEESAEKKSDD